MAIDANFRLGLKDKGLRDVELAPGWAYFVEETRFQHHVKTHLDQKEVFISSRLKDYRAHSGYRLAPASHNWMLLIEQILEIRKVTYHLGRGLDNVRAMGLYARMVLVTYKKARSKSYF